MVTAAQAREVNSLEKDLVAAAEGGRVDYDVTVAYLRLLRKLHLRRSAIVAHYGIALLNKPALRHKLGDELWDVLEQVAIAAMDINQLQSAKECIGALMLKFRKSLRVGRLEGMWLEAKGWWDQAERVYEGLLQDHPQDQKIQKRQVAVLRSQGRLLEASEKLRLYLETYQADTDAWRELASLYLSMSMLKQAAFCYEELLLSSPANPIFNLHYAEILYSLGGSENLTLAKSYYAAAIEHSAGENARALWGAVLVEAALQQSATKGSKGAKTESSSVLGKVASEALIQMYKSKCSSKSKSTEAVISQLDQSK